MKALNEFSLPISGLLNGVHKYQFSIESDFFQHFEDSPIPGGRIDAEVILDKKVDMLVFDLDIHGDVQAACDRCLANINLPVEGDYRLIVKYGIEEKEDGEIVYISEDANSFNLAKYLFELVCLSIPISKTYDCEEDDPQPCDFDTLNELGPKSEEEEAEGGNDVWNVLKDIDLN